MNQQKNAVLKGRKAKFLAAACMVFLLAASSAPLPQPEWMRLTYQHLLPPRVGSALTLNPVNEVALLFGGLNSDGLLDDFWLTDGRAWMQFHTQTTPEARASASMVFDEARREAVLFGGANAEQILLGDTWIFDGVDWVQQQPLNSPSPRASASMTYDDERNIVVLFGGQADLGGKYWEALNEMWVWDDADWQQQFPETLPPSRWGAKMVYGRARKEVVLYGGANVSFREDTWIWDGVDLPQPGVFPNFSCKVMVG